MGTRTISRHVRNLPKRDTNPAASNAKAVIRNNVLEAIGADRAHVLDAFAGNGHMHHQVWHRAAGYTGCDLKFYPDDRLAYVCDNLRLLRALDLGRFNVFDLDAYGSPWEQVYILASRRQLGPGERIGLVLTEGQALKLKMGGMARALALLAGLRTHCMPGLSKALPELIDRALATTLRMMHAELEHRWEAASKTGSAVRYIGMVLKGYQQP